ncbi:hypothetical protein HS5_03990 [Acidianus sp. HS-5]|nr:hypothetical protein HS5_03990 [Acidianus sp. HS-5]
MHVKINVISEYLHISENPKPMPSEIKKNSAVISQFIQTGRAEVAVERDFVHFTRVGDDIAIPANTVRGAVRSRLEVLYDCSCYNFLGNRPSTTVSRKYKEIFRPKRKHSDNFEEEGVVCPVCNVFGTAGLASRITFTDFKLTKGNVKFLNMQGFTYEVVTRGSTFEGDVIGNLTMEEWGMLLWGMGCRKGKFKVMLMGRFKFQRKDFARVKFEVDDQDLIKACEEFENKNSRYLHDVEEDWK